MLPHQLVDTLRLPVATLLHLVHIRHQQEDTHHHPHTHLLDTPQLLTVDTHHLLILLQRVQAVTNLNHQFDILHQAMARVLNEVSTHRSLIMPTSQPLPPTAPNLTAVLIQPLLATAPNLTAALTQPLPATAPNLIVTHTQLLPAIALSLIAAPMLRHPVLMVVQGLIPRLEHTDQARLQAHTEQGHLMLMAKATAQLLKKNTARLLRLMEVQMED